MADPNAILQALRDPNLQTGPFPQWPTLPPMQQPQSRYLENDPTAWQGGDFPTHPDPWSIVLSLLGARAARSSPTMARATAASRSGDPGIAAPSDARPRLYPSNPVAGVPEVNDWASVKSAANPRSFAGDLRYDMIPQGQEKAYDFPGGNSSNVRAGQEWIGDRPQVLQDMDYAMLIANRQKFSQELGRLRLGADTGPGLRTDPNWLESALGKIDAEIARRRSSNTPKLY